MNSNHFFSVNYNDLSQDKSKLILTEVANRDSLTMSITTNREDKEVYFFPISSVQNTRIVILNEETGNSVVITPTESAPAQFELSLFFIEELKRSALGFADRYLVVETDSNFSVRNAASVSAATREVYIPRYFYGPKEDVKEALPKDRQIIHVFKEKPRLMPAFPDDPENLRFVSQLEEDMSYYVYMYQLPNGDLCIYDEHFNPDAYQSAVTKKVNSRSLGFSLSGNLNSSQLTPTWYALNLWGAQITGSVTVDIYVTYVSLPSGTLGLSYRMPHYWSSSNQTWYVSSRGNQIAGYNVSSQRDILTQMNSNVSWFYGTSGSPAYYQYDWVTVMLHEVCHGLGFDTLLESDGSYVYTTDLLGSAGTSYPSIFDRQLFQGSSGYNLPSLNQSQRATLIISDNDLFAGSSGSYLVAANGGSRVLMYAPTTWNPNASVVHWDFGITFLSFMTPGLFIGTSIRTIDSRVVAIMRDMGWSIPPPPPSYYIGTSAGDYSGGSTIYADSSGYASIALFAFSNVSSPGSYVWSAQFYGQANSWYLWPSGNRADIGVYLYSWHAGGTLRIECAMYSGGSLLGTGFYYLDILP